MKLFTTLKAAKSSNLWVLKIAAGKYAAFETFTELNAYRKSNNIPLFN